MSQDEPIDFPLHLPAEISATIFFYSPIHIWPLVIEHSDIRRAIRERTEEMDHTFIVALRRCFPPGQPIGTITSWGQSDRCRELERMDFWKIYRDSVVNDKVERIIPILVAGYIRPQLFQNELRGSWVNLGQSDWRLSLDGLAIDLEVGSDLNVVPLWTVDDGKAIDRVRHEVGDEGLVDCLGQQIEGISMRNLARHYAMRRMADVVCSFYGLLNHLGLDITRDCADSLCLHSGILGPTLELIRRRKEEYLAEPSEREREGVLIFSIIILRDLVLWRETMNLKASEMRVVDACFDLIETASRGRETKTGLLGLWDDYMSVVAPRFPRLCLFFSGKYFTTPGSDIRITLQG